MNTKQLVLSKLQYSSSYISGQLLADELNVSRASIWKAINALKKEGYNIDSVTNKGYRLISDSDVLSDKEILSCIKDYSEQVNIYTFKTVTSTNSLLKEMYDKGCPEYTLIVADEQTHGRGRLGREFYSPSKTGIYFSLLLKPDFTVSSSIKITSMTAVAVCDAINTLTGINPHIKWINDIFVNNKKVCGILTEASTNFESGELNYIIIGIGINISTINFPDNISDIAGSLNCNISKNLLVGNIINNLIHMYNNFSDDSYIKKYKEYSLMKDKEISYVKNGRIFTGKVIDINDRCELIVDDHKGNIITLNSGDISIKSF